MIDHNRFHIRHELRPPFRALLTDGHINIRFEGAFLAITSSRDRAADDADIGVLNQRGRLEAHIRV
ncbi:MAG: hypothetical protein JSS43_26090 [Proteobacteria bacterium]|nr:hypothetical protein [Pseudomonadota bacterium]